MAVALVLIVVVFAAVFVHVQRMLLGGNSASHPAPVVGGATWGPLVVGLIAFAALGISIWPIERLLHAAAAIVAT